MWIIDFYYLGGVDLWLLLEMSQTLLWVPPNGYCLLCLLALQQFLVTASILRSSAAMYLLCCCYKCCGLGPKGYTAAHSALTADIFCCYSGQGLILSVRRVLFYICHQEVPGAANYQSLLGRFPCKGHVRVHCDVSCMLLEITYQSLSCADCLFCVRGSAWSWKSWLEMSLVFILQIHIWIDLIILVQKKINKYLAQIVICTR